MAQGGERRMLFDIRGKRKHVVRFVYAILAILMGASLFLVVGPVNIAELLGDKNTVSEASKTFEEQAERIEKRLRANPDDANMLVSLSQARLRAGEASAERDPTSGQVFIGPESRQQYEKGVDAWERYVKVAGDEVSPTAATTFANASFTLAQNSRSYTEAFEYLDDAAEAQQIAAEARPSVGYLTTLAAFQMLGGNFDAGQKSGKEAEALANSKQQRKEITKQIDAYEKQGKEIAKSKKQAEKAEKGKGKESLENPLGGLGGTSTATP
jgi:hypothetical protein